jgi:coatomer protein complex subunit epsilon
VTVLLPPQSTKNYAHVTELYQIRSYFYQGNFLNVVNEPVANMSRSDEAQLYKYRSRIELGQAVEVAAEMSEAGSTGGGFEAVRAYAEYRAGEKHKAVEDINELVQADSEDDTVQVIGATILYAEGRVDEALDLLSKHENNLEAYECLLDWPDRVVFR